jgi:two-component system secretion response regulator SsrB
MDRTLSVLVVEDFALISDALVGMLKTVPELRVTGVAANLRDAHAMLLKLRPDLLLTELLLDDGSAIELLRVVRRDRLSTRVIVVTRLRDTFAVTEALSAGADGYVLKSQPSAELFDAIQAVSAGRRYVSPAAEGQLPQTAGATPKRAGLELLSNREIEILRMIAAGTTSAEISQHLSISTKTIDTHRSNMYRKLSLRNQVDLVRFATMHGIGLTPTPMVPADDKAATAWPPAQARAGFRRP